MIETDCLAVVQIVRCSCINLSYLGKIVDDCKGLLVELKERNVTLSFVKLYANMIAHSYNEKLSCSLAERV